MKITLREKKNEKKISLYIDYYHKGVRKSEYLGLYLIPNPQNVWERKENQANRAIAEQLHARRVIEFQSKEYGIRNVLAGRDNFILYFQLLTEKRIDSPGNYGNWKGALRHLKTFADPKLTFNDVTPEWLEAFKSYLVNEATKVNGEPLLPNTVSSYYGKIRATLKQAVKEGIIEKSPTVLVKAPKDSDTQREFLTIEELRKVATTPCDLPVLKTAFLFSTLTGLRYSDLEGLTWRDVHYSSNLGHYIRFQQKKTQGQETLPISEDARQLLGEAGDPNNLVFANLQYSAYNNTKLRKWMNDAGINKYITFHCARHTYATLQLSLGTDIYTVSKLLGHKHLQTTEIYAKIIDENKVAAANKIKLNPSDS